MDVIKLLHGKQDEDKPKRVIRLTGPAAAILLIAALGLIVILMLNYSSGLAERIDTLVEENKELRVLLDEEQKIDVTYVGNKLESISELATAKMTYNGIIHFEEGKIPLITKKEFYMAYRVSMKAGFNLDLAEIKVTDQTVTINLPEAEIYEPSVDEKSFQYFDKSFGLFNPEKMTDLAQAISEAKEDALAQPETQEMKTRAEEQVVVLLTALLENQIGERELIVNVG